MVLSLTPKEIVNCTGDEKMEIQLWAIQQPENNNDPQPLPTQYNI